MAERRDIRTLRLLLEGKCVLLPGITGMSAKLTGDNTPALESFLLGEAGTIAVTVARVFEVLGHKIALEELRAFHPSLHVADGERLMDLVRRGSAAGVKMDVAPTDGTPFRAILVDRVADPDMPLLPVPLGVPDLPEHPALARILSATADDVA